VRMPTVNHYVKELIRSAAFLLVLGALCLAMSVKTEDMYITGGRAQFEKNMENRKDWRFVSLGNSHAAYGVKPGYMKLKGFSAAVDGEDLFETIANAKYFGKEIKWLQSRFPDAVYNDVLGLCKVVSMDEIAKNDYSLTPGRYVGVEPKADDNFDFAERLNLIHLELELLNDEASELAKVISQNFKDLGI